MEFKGISFPFQISRTTGGVETAKYLDDVDSTLLKQSIIQIIATRAGERVREKYFGTTIPKTMFEPNDDITSSYLRQSVFKALSLFEPRITVEDVLINTNVDSGEVIIGIRYAINRTGVQDQFAFKL